MNAPWPPLRRPCGIHRRTAGLLARGVSPTPPSRTHKKSSGEKASARRSQSRGRPRIGGKAYRVPFSPSGAIEGPCLGLCPSFERGCQMERETLVDPARPEDRLMHRSKPTSGEAPNIERRPSCTWAGSSSNGFGGAPRGPNPVLSSHSAVILASATTGFRGRTEFSASAERRSAPNSVSANRRSISCCNRASAS